MHLGRRRPALEPALLEYGRCQGWFHGLYDVRAVPGAGMRLRVPVATPALVPVRARRAGG